MITFDKLFSFMMKPWVNLLVILACILSFYYLDRPLASYFYALNLRDEAFLLTTITKLGISVPYLVGFFLGALYFRYIRIHPQWEAKCWFVWLSMALSGGVCGVLKVCLGRARPDMWFEQHIWGFYGFKTTVPYWSFPSGHTTTIISVCLALGILLPRYFISLIMVGIVVALSRVLLTQHYLTDVIAGSYLSIIIIGYLLGYLRKKPFFAEALPVKNT